MRKKIWIKLGAICLGISIFAIGNTQKAYSEEVVLSNGKHVVVFNSAEDAAGLAEQYLDQQAAANGYTTVHSDADFHAPAPAQPTVPAQTTTPKKVKGSYVLLATGTVVKPGGSIPLSQLATAVFVNGTGQNVMYTAIATNGAYSYKTDTEPNWAYVGSVAPGGTISLSSYAAWMVDPYNTHLTIELRGTKDYEYSFLVNKTQ